VMGGDDPTPLDYSAVKPEENRFKKKILVDGLDEPMQMDFSSDGIIFIAERRGEIKRFDPRNKQLNSVGIIPVMTRYEDGLLGLTLDPYIDENRWLYLFYTSPDGNEFRVSRFTINEQYELIPNT